MALAAAPGCGGGQHGAGSGDAGRGDDAASAASEAGPDAGGPSDAASVEAAPASVCAPTGRLPPLTESRVVYADDTEAVLDVALTVPDTAALQAVNDDVAGAKAQAFFRQVDLGDAAPTLNATIELRGSTSRKTFQKSYQVKLTDKDVTWRGQRVVNLLKHPYDLSRARERLSMDYLQTVPDFTSLRTRFVHVAINGQDAGLYEWVEEPDKSYLASHGLDPRGVLYKSKTFGFLPIDAKTLADPVALDALISAKANPDPARLARMVAAVNDPDQDINDVIARYFQRDNYLTWLAVNIVFQDFDTGSQNFMLYSPGGCDGFYFLPWDYDGAWGWYETPGNPPRPRWRAGAANWWWVPLHQRFLADAQNRADLDAAITRLTGSMSDARTTELMSGYHDTIKRYVADPAGPDYWNLPTANAGTPAAVVDWEAEYRRIDGAVSRATAEYQHVKTRPMPFWLYMPIVAGGTVTFSWQPAFDVVGDGIVYELQVSKRLGFLPGDLSYQRQMVLTRRDLDLAVLTVDGLEPGDYFWRVVARRAGAAEGSDDWQLPYQVASPMRL